VLFLFFAGEGYDVVCCVGAHVGGLFYKFNYDVESWSYGIGLNFVTKKIDVRFDYSYSPFGVYLGDVQKLTLGIGLK